jgi:hypothetical protein
MGIAASVGLFSPDVYRDNALVRAAWYGNDLVTLFVATPLLIVSARLMQGGSERGMLLTLGMLAYSGYNYSFYLFGAAHNDLDSSPLITSKCMTTRGIR